MADSAQGQELPMASTAGSSGRSSAAPRARGRAAVRHYSGDDYRPEDSVSYLMRLALTAFRRRLDEQMAEHDLTGVQMLPLLAIGRGLCATAAALARLTDTDPGAMTRLLDRLESKGLLRRSRSVDDRRVIELELTPAGRRFAGKIPYAIAGTLNEALSDFSAAEVDALRGMLRRIIANTGGIV
jgi:DNA-binding MarR family transcriptional regulator